MQVKEERETAVRPRGPGSVSFCVSHTCEQAAQKKRSQSGGNEQVS